MHNIIIFSYSFLVQNIIIYNIELKTMNIKKDINMNHIKDELI